MLLAAISTTATVVDNVITYDGNSWNGSTWTSSSKTTLSYLPSRTFSLSANTPYITSNVMYYIGKPSDNTISFIASAVETGTLYYAWMLNNATYSNTIVGTAGSSKTLTLPAYSGRTFRQKIWNFTYKGERRQWKAPHAGDYTLYCWGAGSGYIPSGTYKADRGRGGYAEGTITFSEGQVLFAYVGQDGQNVTISTTSNGEIKNQAWNGGGGGIRAQAGGGATDFRLNEGTSATQWSNATSLRSRIIVAGGGGGADAYTKGGDAGGFEGSAGNKTNGTPGQGGKQDAGGSGSPSGSFGVGGHDVTVDGGGGGGGWYGGGHGVGGCDAGGGGSSFVSGLSGCKAINSSGTSVSSPNHYSGKVFKTGTAKLVDGGSSMPSPSGTLEIGHSDNGYARIVYVNP